MSGHNALFNLENADWVMRDPGSGQPLPRSQSGCLALKTGAGAETNTLAHPSKAGLLLILCCQAHGGGDRTVTVADAWDQAGNTTLVFAAAGDTVVLCSVPVGGGYRWRPLAMFLRGAALTAQLTALTHTAPGTPDYAIQDLTNSSAYGFVSQDEGNTVLSVIANLQTRLAEVEARLTAAGVVAAP